MSPDRVKKIYDKFIKKADAEDAAVLKMAGQWFTKVTDDVADAALLFASDLAPCIVAAAQSDRLRDTRNLLQAISEGAGRNNHSPGEHAGWLVLWNSWFHRHDTTLTLPNFDSRDAIAMLVEINNQKWDADQGFIAFCAGAANPHTELLTMRKDFARVGLKMDDVVLAMHFLRQHMVPVTALKSASAEAIHHFSKLTPPLSGFAGFAGWGPGNNQDIEKNKVNHFLKHVLDAHHKEDLPWKGEPTIWWETLDLKLTRAVAEAKMGAALWNSVKQHWPAEPTGWLPFDKVETVVGQIKAFTMPEPLKTQLVTDYAAKYAATAITLSQSMTNIIVHTDATGGNVFLKGIKGPFYLGGRIEGTTLGLSTCFVPGPTIDKVTVNEDKKLWTVSKP